MACVMLNLVTNFAIIPLDRNPSRRYSARPKNLESPFRSLWKTNNLEHINHTTTYKLLIKRPQQPETRERGCKGIPNGWFFTIMMCQSPPTMIDCDFLLRALLFEESLSRCLSGMYQWVSPPPSSYYRQRADSKKRICSFFTKVLIKASY